MKLLNEITADAITNCSREHTLVVVSILLRSFACQEGTLDTIHAKGLGPHGYYDGVVGVARVEEEGDAAGATWRGRRRRGPTSFQRGGDHAAERT